MSFTWRSATGSCSKRRTWSLFLQMQSRMRGLLRKPRSDSLGGSFLNRTYQMFSSKHRPTSFSATPPPTFASLATAFRGRAVFKGRQIRGRTFTTSCFLFRHPTTAPSSSSRVCARSRNWSTTSVELLPVERSEMCVPLLSIARSSRLSDKTLSQRKLLRDMIAESGRRAQRLRTMSTTIVGTGLH